MGSRTKALVLLGILLGVIGVGVVMAITGTVPISGGVTLSAPDGPAVTVNGNTDAQLEDPFPNSNTVDLTTEAGNATFSSSGDSSATIHKDDIIGTSTQVTSISATNDLTINPEDKPQVTVGGGIDSITFRSMSLDDSTVDFDYSAGSTATVTVNGLQADTTISAVDGNGNVLDTTTTDASGSATLSLSSGSNSVQLQTYDASVPVISNIQPSGDLSTEPTQISVDINDSDFSTGGGDSVDVTIDLDGSQTHTETISSNSTITTSMPNSGQTGGDHSISVSATDQFGESSSESSTYNVPGNLFIRNELDHSELIPADGEVRFFGDDNVYSRTAPNGIVNMTNLPVNQDFIIEVEPTDGNFTTRTIYVEGIYEQQSAYVLNTSAVSTVESRFVLNDPSGQYDSESLLKIQRAINVSGNLTYQTIIADEFGVEGVTATLEEGQRYELRVSSSADSQSVGPYRAETSETVEVVPGRSEVPLPDADTPWSANAQIQNDTISWRYEDIEQETTQLKVYIHERNNKSNQPVANKTYMDLGNASSQVTIPANQTDREFVVKFIISRDGETFVHPVPVSNRANLLPPLGSNWTAMIGVGMLFLMAGAFSVLNAGIGAVIVSVFGGVLWFIGFLGGATSAVAISIALLISILGHVYSGSRY